MTPSRRARRRSRTRPAPSRPTMLQLFLPKSTPRMRMSFMPPSYRHPVMVEERGGPFHKGGGSYCRPRSGATRASAAKRRIGELRLEAAEQAKASLRVLIPALEERARAAMAAGRMREAVSIVGRLAGIAAEVNGS